MSDLPTVQWLREHKPHLKPIIILTDAQGEERVLYALQPKQVEAYNLTPLARPKGEDGPIHIGFGGAAGGGKSYLARVIATSVAFSWPGSSTLIYRETKDDVKKNHVERFKLEVPQYFEGRKLWSYADMCLTWFNGSKTYFGYLQHENDVHRAQGPAFDCMIFEESTFYTWFMISWLTGNRLRSSVEGTEPFAFYPSNPGGQGMAWYKRLFVQRRYRGAERPEDYAFIQSKLADNIELEIMNPSYRRKFDTMPEPDRSWMRDGNFSAGAGSALSQIDWRRHLVKPFKDEIPDYWLQFGSFDWGFHHPFVFGHYTVTEDGNLFKVETVTGRRLLPPQQIERIKSIVPVEKLHYIVAGHDVKAKQIARGENVPTIQEHFMEHNILLSLANIDRKQGLQQLRKMLDWETSGPFVDGKPTEGDPLLRFFDTPNNRKCLEQLENMAVDPSDPEDVLKVNADDFGEGGDDMYDETRYACASRPPTPESPWGGSEPDAWSPAVLEHEMKEGRRVKRHIDRGKGIPPEAVT